MHLTLRKRSNGSLVRYFISCKAIYTSGKPEDSSAERNQWQTANGAALAGKGKLPEHCAATITPVQITVRWIGKGTCNFDNPI
jgi:hypothetical protein